MENQNIIRMDEIVEGMAKVYGEGDTCIEVESPQIANEFYYVDTRTNLLEFSDGTILEVEYDGKWKITVRHAGLCEVTRGAGPLHNVENSDIIYLFGELKWVKHTFENRNLT